MVDKESKIKIKQNNKELKEVLKLLKKSAKNLFKHAEKLESVSQDFINNALEIAKNLNSKKILKKIKKIILINEKISIHNDSVEILNKLDGPYKYDNLIANPLAYSKEELQRNKFLMDYISKFEVINNVAFNKFNKFKQFNKNYEKICEEYIDYQEYLKYLHPEINHFFTSKEVEENYKKLNELALKNKRGRYYDFKEHINFRKYIDKANNFIIEEQMKDDFFVNGQWSKLDEAQKKAILTDDNVTQVIAGAGCGKTFTICGKIAYLLEKNLAKPQDFLILSYSKKSADDLKTKVKKISKEVDVGTFHAIGLSILNKHDNKKHVVESQFDAIIEKYFSEELFKRKKVAFDVLTFYSSYLHDIDEMNFKEKGEEYEFYKTIDLDTFKYKYAKYSNDYLQMETAKKEHVKSYQELMIANFYFLNGINYEYEKPYDKIPDSADKRKYLPDFYLTDYDIYHEHFAIDRNGRADQFGETNSKEYVENIFWKRNIHEQNDTRLIETYSYEFKEETVFINLENKLKALGVEFKPLSEEETNNYLKSIYHNVGFESFINLVKTFLNLYKSKYKDKSGFDLLRGYNEGKFFTRTRQNIFLDIVSDIYDYYINKLRETEKIDFDDMILKSCDYIDELDDFKYRYIIVDEFQDISSSRLKFLKKLVDHGNSKLFVVGDDWQSIYRFAGCDINIFLNLKEYFPYLSIVKIQNTYRNSIELNEIAGSFIMENKEQIAKKIHSPKHLNNPIKALYYSKNSKISIFLKAIEEILEACENPKILILGRNNRDLESILNDEIYLERKFNNEGSKQIKIKKYPNVEARFSTVHASKGLEEDYVILINASDDNLGFPNKTEDDPLLNLVLEKGSEFLYSEERRLWYVALTRTRNSVYILVDQKNPSPFYKEIQDECEALNTMDDGLQKDYLLCPNCKTGHLVLRKNTKRNDYFYGCSNYPLCNYTNNYVGKINKEKRCPICGDYMVLKTGKNGNMFYSCCNYPKCRYKTPYKNNRYNGGYYESKYR